MLRLRPSEERAAAYRAAGLWDDRSHADGIPAAAAARPDALALADIEDRLTWRDLDGAVNAAAASLRASGVGEGLLLVVGNTVGAAVVLHAALRVGVPTVVLDRRCGPADVVAALEVLGGGARLVAPDAERSRLTPPGRDAVPLERVAAGEEPAGSPAQEPDRDAPALVLLTSGTTGRPKAVVHSLNTLTSGARNLAGITGAGDEDVVYLVSPLASITGVMQLLLASDGHIALVLDDDFDADATLDRMAAVGATILGGAPVIAERLLGASRRGGARLPLRILALGGAMLPRPLLDLATNVFGIEIARVYGSSEAPNHTGSAPSDDGESRLADDGALQPGSEVRVGSKEHPEEGLVRGPAVFLGYGDPEDDAVAFEEGWYRTGDLVEVADGRLTVTGRLKEVVNRNGLKISPAEIDQALVRLRGALELACFGVPDPVTGERLAVAIWSDGTDVTLAAVVDHLLARGVARRKLPEQVVAWDGPLPRTTSGKVVRSQLVRDAPGKRTELAPRLHKVETEVETD